MEMFDKVLSRWKYWALGLSLVAGIKFYNKWSSKDKIHSQLFELCSQESECEEIVDAQFDDCFEASYKMGIGDGRRSYNRTTFDQASFVACFKTEDGKQVFQAAH